MMSFAFRVGDPVPRSEWKRRGLPARLGNHYAGV